MLSKSIALFNNKYEIFSADINHIINKNYIHYPKEDISLIFLIIYIFFIFFAFYYNFFHFLLISLNHYCLIFYFYLFHFLELTTNCLYNYFLSYY